jgi:hypothetical protein
MVKRLLKHIGWVLDVVWLLLWKVFLPANGEGLPPEFSIYPVMSKSVLLYRA